MTETKESFREKLILVSIQTLLFGFLLAVFGYFMDKRIESYKHELGKETEKTKVLLASLDPELQLRRKAYAEFRMAAQNAKQVLEVYYHLADTPLEHDLRAHQIASLRTELGIGSGSGGGGSWATHSDAVGVIEKLANLREQYEDVASDEIIKSVDTFIEGLIIDLKAGIKPSNQNTRFENSARRNLDQEFKKLKVAIEQALGIDQLPVK